MSMHIHRRIIVLVACAAIVTACGTPPAATTPAQPGTTAGASRPAQTPAGTTALDSATSAGATPVMQTVTEAATPDQARAQPPATPAPATTSAPLTDTNPEKPNDTTLPSPKSTALSVGPAPWSLVVVGDSIPYNSPQDCPRCTSFADRYAAAIIEATGHPVKVRNYSQHTGLQIDDLLGQLKLDKGLRTALANADIIVVGIAHNDTAWNRNDDPCDGPNGNNPDWPKYNTTCATAAAEIFRPKFESVFAQIVALRAGKPTIFRTINAYNDWIGVSDVPPEATDATRVVLDAWSAMICKAAQENSFTCADIYHAFNGPDGLTPAGNLLAKDTIHPSDKGNEVIARVLADLGYAPLADTNSPITAP